MRNRSLYHPWSTQYPEPATKVDFNKCFNVYLFGFYRDFKTYICIHSSIKYAGTYGKYILET